MELKFRTKKMGQQRLIKILFFIAALFLASGNALAQETGEERGDMYFDQKKYSTAIAMYKIELIASPREVQNRLRVKIGDCYYALGKRDNALKSFEKAGVEERLEELDSKLITIGAPVSVELSKDQLVNLFLDIVENRNPNSMYIYANKASISDDKKKQLLIYSAYLGQQTAKKKLAEMSVDFDETVQPDLQKKLDYLDEEYKRTEEFVRNDKVTSMSYLPIERVYEYGDFNDLDNVYMLVASSSKGDFQIIKYHNLQVVAHWSDEALSSDRFEYNKVSNLGFGDCKFIRKNNVRGFNGIKKEIYYAHFAKIEQEKMAAKKAAEEAEKAEREKAEKEKELQAMAEMAKKSDLASAEKLLADHIFQCEIPENSEEAQFLDMLTGGGLYYLIKIAFANKYAYVYQITSKAKAPIRSALAAQQMFNAKDSARPTSGVYFFNKNKIDTKDHTFTLSSNGLQLTDERGYIYKRIK